MGSQANYVAWPTLPELFPVAFPGVKTSRDDVLVDIDRGRLMVRMEQSGVNPVYRTVEKVNSWPPRAP